MGMPNMPRAPNERPADRLPDKGEDGVWNWGTTVGNSWRMSGDVYDNFNRPDDRCPCSVSALRRKLDTRRILIHLALRIHRNRVF